MARAFPEICAAKAGRFERGSVRSPGALKLLSSVSFQFSVFSLEGRFGLAYSSVVPRCGGAEVVVLRGVRSTPAPRLMLFKGFAGSNGKIPPKVPIIMSGPQ